MVNIASYISGFVDGEGCFCISFSPRARFTTGWEVRASFAVSQNQDRAEVLELMQQYFGCGSIRRDFHDNTVKYEVRKLQDLITRIIPHFQTYQLLSAKDKQFQIFTEICLAMDRLEHQNPVGLRQIALRAFIMNPGARRRKYLQETVLSSLDKMKI